MILNDIEISFKTLEQEIFKYVCSLGRMIFAEILAKIDTMLMLQRDSYKYRHKGLRATTIKTVMGEVELDRVGYTYKDENDENSMIYLLDEELGLESVSGQISENLAEIIVKACCEMPYRKAAESISETTGQTISHMGVWGVTQDFGEVVKQKEIIDAKRAKKSEGLGKVERKIIFEEQDGIHLRLQGKDQKKNGGTHSEMKVAIAYSGAEKTGKDRYNLVDKVAYAGFESVEEFYAGKEGVIASYYNVDEIEQRILNGDGASWIKNSITDEDVTYQLDPYHRNKAIWKHVSDHDKRSDLRKLLYNEDIEGLLKKIEEYINETADKIDCVKEHENYKQLFSYYSNNKDGMISYKSQGLELPPPEDGVEYRNLGTMESNIFSIIGFRMKGRRANWSIRGGNHLAKLLTLKATDRLVETLETVGKSKIPEKYSKEIYEEISPPLSAAKSVERVGKGWNGFMKGVISPALKGIKEIFGINFFDKL